MWVTIGFPSLSGRISCFHQQTQIDTELSTVRTLNNVVGSVQGPRTESSSEIELDLIWLRFLYL